MAYIDPSKVDSPKARWELHSVVYSTGEGGWSVAEGGFDGRPCLGVRWNGHANEEGPGNPQSRGYPTWFIIPDELEGAIRMEIARIEQSQKFVTCEITKPEAYDDGAWQVVAILSDEAKSELGSDSLAFPLPVLANRFAHARKGYVTPVSNMLWGKFVDGKWYGELYTNGVPEEANPTTLEAWQEAFVQGVVKRIRGGALDNELSM